MFRAPLAVLLPIVVLAGCGDSKKKPAPAGKPPAPEKPAASPVRLGVLVTPVTAPMVRFSRKAGYPLRQPGVMVLRVTPQSPAERIGIRGFSRSAKSINMRGDEIVSIDGQPVRTGIDLKTAINARRPGESVTISVARPGKQGAARRVLPLRLKLAGA